MMEVVQYNVNASIATITLNRPEKRNAISPELINALKESFRKADADPEVKVVILKANGEAFCAGADLSYLQQLQHFSYEENLNDSLALKDLFWQLYSFRKVVVAQVQGPALAGGCGLITVCDFCFASTDAKFGYTEVKIGFVPALVMVFLLKKIGEARSRQLLISGELFTAQDMKEMGLVHGISDKMQLENDVVQFAKRLIRSNSSEAMMLTKNLMIELHADALLSALDQAAKVNAQARSTEDCRKGIAAFLNKLKIDWSGVMCLSVCVYRCLHFIELGRLGT